MLKHAWWFEALASRMDSCAKLMVAFDFVQVAGQASNIPSDGLIVDASPLERGVSQRDHTRDP